MKIPLGFGKHHSGRRLLSLTVEQLRREHFCLQVRRAESIGCGFDLFHLDVWSRAIEKTIEHKERKCARKQ